MPSSVVLAESEERSGYPTYMWSGQLWLSDADTAVDQLFRPSRSAHVSPIGHRAFDKMLESRLVLAHAPTTGRA